MRRNWVGPATASVDPLPLPLFVPDALNVHGAAVVILNAIAVRSCISEPVTCARRACWRPLFDPSGIPRPRISPAFGALICANAVILSRRFATYVFVDERPVRST